MAKEYSGLPAVFGAPVPDFFADDATGFEIMNGTVRISLGTIVRSEPVHPSDAAMAIIGRLILPTEAAQRLCLGLYDFLKKQGLDPSDLASGGGTAN